MLDELVSLPLECIADHGRNIVDGGTIAAAHEAI